MEVGESVDAGVIAHDVARAGEAVFVGDDAIEAHGTARVELAGADADLGAEAVAKAIGEARGAVVEDVGGVDFGEEARGGGGVLGEDGVSVVRAVLFDVAERGVERVDDADGEDQAGVLGVPFVVGDEIDGDGGQKRLGAGVAANLHGFLFECVDERRQDGGGNGCVDQYGFDRVADGGVLGLAVDDNAVDDVGIGGLVDVDVTDTVGVAENRDECVALDVLHEGVGAARNDQVDEVVHAEEGLDGFAAVDAADGAGGNAGVRERGVHGVENGTHGVFYFAAALEDNCVTGLDGERGDLGDGVGAGFEDDSEDAERDGDFFEGEIVGQEGAGQNASGGIGELAHGADAIDHDAKFVRGEQQALEQGVRELAGTDERLGSGDVGGVGAKDGGGIGIERGGDGLQRFVLGCGGQSGKHAAGGFGALRDLDDGSVRTHSGGGAHAWTLEWGWKTVPIDSPATTRSTTPGSRPLAMTVVLPASATMRAASIFVAMPPRPRPLETRA